MDDLTASWGISEFQLVQFAQFALEYVIGRFPIIR